MLARIDAAGEQRRGHFARLALQRRRVLPLGDRVQIDHAIDAVVLVLQRHPVADRAEVVAERGKAGRLDAGEDALHCRCAYPMVSRQRFGRRRDGRSVAAAQARGGTAGAACRARRKRRTVGRPAGRRRHPARPVPPAPPNANHVPCQRCPRREQQPLGDPQRARHRAGGERHARQAAAHRRVSHQVASAHQQHREADEVEQRRDTGGERRPDVLQPRQPGRGTCGCHGAGVEHQVKPEIQCQGDHADLHRRRHVAAGEEGRGQHLQQHHRRQADRIGGQRLRREPGTLAVERAAAEQHPHDRKAGDRERQRRRQGQEQRIFDRPVQRDDGLRRSAPRT